MSSGAADQAFSDYSQHPETTQFIAELVEEEGFDAEQIKQVLAAAEKKQSILDAISRPAERTLNWGQYRNIFIKDARIQGGVDFINRNEKVLKDAQNRYGVPPEVITAIIGVETFYGRHTGNYRVIDALSTLAFDYPKRAPFFRSELKQFFVLTREQEQDPLSLKGSYAGAMGLGQFMPSSYRAYAAGYADDGFIDIWSDEADAIWSVASYLSAHGWQVSLPVAEQVQIADSFDSSIISTRLKPELTQAQLHASGVMIDAFDTDTMATLMALIISGESSGDTDRVEYWVGWKNFYVITRYNHSELYAMAVFQLSELIQEAAESGD